MFGLVVAVYFILLLTLAVCVVYTVYGAYNIVKSWRNVNKKGFITAFELDLFAIYSILALVSVAGFLLMLIPLFM